MAKVADKKWGINGVIIISPLKSNGVGKEGCVPPFKEEGEVSPSPVLVEEGKAILQVTHIHLPSNKFPNGVAANQVIGWK